MSLVDSYGRIIAASDPIAIQNSLPASLQLQFHNTNNTEGSTSDFIFSIDTNIVVVNGFISVIVPPHLSTYNDQLLFFVNND